MKKILGAALVSVALMGGAVLPAAAQQFDPAVLEATVARLNLTDAQRPICTSRVIEGLLFVPEFQPFRFSGDARVDSVLSENSCSVIFEGVAEGDLGISDRPETLALSFDLTAFAPTALPIKV